MTKTCEYCGCEYKTIRGESRYCGRDCARMARKKATFLAQSAEAAVLGITVDDTRYNEERRFRRTGLYKLKKPKSYAEIKAANRKHPIAAGWRGQPVLGGGGAGARHNDPWLSINELPRCPGVVSERVMRAVNARRARNGVPGGHALPRPRRGASLHAN